MTARPEAMVIAALDLAARGWRVVPLHIPMGDACSCSEGHKCEHIGKHPRIRAWAQRASTDGKQIRSWWHDWPEANVGVALGRNSGVVALDIDARNGGYERLSNLERQHGPLPRTVSDVSGGGGQHFLFRVHRRVRYVDLGGGAELLADGS